jgi:hypothetical protein
MIQIRRGCAETGVNDLRRRSMRRFIAIATAIIALAVPAQALATPVTGTVVRTDTLGFRGSIWFNSATHTLGPNGEVIAHFNHAQRLALVPY